MTHPTEPEGRVTSMIRDSLVEPYFYTPDSLPGLDFTREVIQPGTVENFPDGVIGIRVDGDFWAVAAIHFKFSDTPLKDIVAELWPQYLAEANFEPDSGSAEQKIKFANQYAESQDRIILHLDNRNKELQDQLTRLRAGRHDLNERHSVRHRALNDYFIRQYEYLLMATAHEVKPEEGRPGICSICGLYGSNRIHLRHFIDLRAAGYEPEMKPIIQFPDDEQSNALPAQIQEKE